MNEHLNNNNVPPKSENNGIYFIIPAAGNSLRYGNKNKIFEKIDNEQEVDVLESIIYLAMCLGIIKKVIVGFNKKSKEIDKYIEAHSVSPSRDIHDDKMIKNLKKVCFVEGGSTRQETVYNSLKFINENYKNSSNSWVIIHDAARPCMLVYDLLEFINKTIELNQSSIMALPLGDTLKRVRKDKIIKETIPREDIWVAQTPQMFRFKTVFESIKFCIDNNIKITDESQAIELNGHSCRVHYGRPYNIKITHEMDITVAKCIFNHIERYILEDVEFNSQEDQI